MMLCSPRATGPFPDRLQDHAPEWHQNRRLELSTVPTSTQSSSRGRSQARSTRPLARFVRGWLHHLVQPVQRIVRRLLCRVFVAHANKMDGQPTRSYNMHSTAAAVQPNGQTWHSSPSQHLTGTQYGDHGLVSYPTQMFKTVLGMACNMERAL